MRLIHGTGERVHGLKDRDQGQIPKDSEIRLLEMRVFSMGG